MTLDKTQNYRERAAALANSYEYFETVKDFAEAIAALCSQVEAETLERVEQTAKGMAASLEKDDPLDFIGEVTVLNLLITALQATPAAASRGGVDV